MEKSALVVGIADYGSGGRSLPGAANDLLEWSDVLRRTGHTVCELADAEATKEAIVESLRAMISRPRSQNVFVFAGHGTHVPGDSGGALEGLVGSPPAPDAPIDSYILRDCDLIDIIIRARAADSRLTLILDCCFAEGLISYGGTLPVDELPALRTRYYPVEKAHAPCPVRLQEVPFPPGSEPLVIAAARLTQRAYEDDRLEPGKSHGVFSYFATRALAETPMLSAAELVKRIRPKVAGRYDPAQVAIVPTRSGRESLAFL